MKTLNKRWWLVGLLFILIGLFFALDLGRYLSLGAIKSRQGELVAWRDAQPVGAGLVFFGTYVAVTALSLPGAAIMTLAAGALFGLGWGTLIVSFASSLGATLAFLASRWLLGDWVQARFGNRLAALNAGMAKDGGFYLFTLRLAPVLPFFMVNLAMGLTPIRPWTLLLGQPAGHARRHPGLRERRYAARTHRVVGRHRVAGPAGRARALGAATDRGPQTDRRAAGAQGLRPVASPEAVRPQPTVIVIGGGSAGLVTAYIAAALRAKVTLVEKHRMGGDCLNTGCVPSKALIRSAKLLSHIKRAPEFGIRAADAQFDFAEVMERVQRVVKTIEPHDSAARYTELGVDVVEGTARIVSPWEVEVTQRDIVVAAGARPFVPPLPGIEQVEVLTSDNVWNLRQRPDRLLVLGGGPIGSELTQAFARLGSRVTQVEMAPRLLLREDPEVSVLVEQRFRDEGIAVLAGHAAKRIDVVGADKFLIAEHQGQDVRIPFDALLVAVGRSANLRGYGLEELGVTTGRTIDVNGCLQTNFPNIYAAGDVAGPTSSPIPLPIRPGTPQSTRCSIRSRSSGPTIA